MLVAGDALAKPDGIGPKPLQCCLVQQHLKLSPVDRVLRPLVARQKTARLAVNIAPIASNQRPFFGLNPRQVQRRSVQTQVIEFTYGIGLQVDAHAQRSQFFNRLKHDAGNANLVKGERCGQAANAATGDENGWDGVLIFHGAHCRRSKYDLVSCTFMQFLSA